MSPEHLQGEHARVPERIILAPSPGVFQPAGGNSDGVVHEGETIGVVESSGTRTPVVSRFTGRFMGHLAHAGERVRQDQPVAWLRIGAA